VKIPTLDGPSVQARGIPTPYGNTNQDAGGDIMAKAVAGLGQDIGQAAERIEAVKQKANAVAVNDLITQYQEKNTTALDGDGQTPGFLAARGKEAAAKRADTLKDLEVYGGKLEESLANDTQKALFRKHAQGIYLGTRARVESHVMRQNEEAMQASLSGRIATSLSSIASNYTDAEGTATKTLDDTVEAVRAFAAPYGDQDAKVAALRQKAAEVRLNGYLGAKDWNGAQTLFSQVQKDLGAGAAEYQVRIDNVKRDGAAGAMAQQVAKEFAKPDGRIDEGKALEKLRASGVTDSQLLKAAEHRLSELGNQADDVWKKETQDISQKAYSAFDLGHSFYAIPENLREELRQRNPELHHRLYDDTLRAGRLRRMSDSDARREQAEIDKVARNAYLELPAAVRADTDLGEFLAGRGVSKGAASEFPVLKRVAGEQVQKGEASTAEEFKKRAKAASEGTVHGKRDQADFDAEATIAYQRLSERLKRPPSDKEAAEEISHLVEKRVTPGRFWGTNEEPAWKALARERQAGGAAKPSTPTLTPAQPAGNPPPAVNAAPLKSTLAPGKYIDKKGRTVIVDSLGNKRLQL
jgi:hypothetical protein